MSAHSQRDLFWCMIKLENLSNLFASGFQTNSVKRLVYWGYLLGRISQLLKVFHIKKYWTDRVSEINLTKVMWFLRGKLTSEQMVLIHFGFGIGFCQEFFKGTAEKWWNPLVPHLMDDSLDLVEIQRITLANLPILSNWNLFEMGNIIDPDKPLEWTQIAEELRKEHQNIRYTLRWQEDPEAPHIPGKIMLCKL